MDNIGIIVGVVLSLVAGGGIALHFYRKKNLEKLFSQTYEMVKQVPKKKKNSFILLIFKESLAGSKKNKASLESKLNNPKFLNIQLVQMSHILKNSSNVENKIMKRSLKLLNNYQVWEKEKIAKDKKDALDQAS